MALWGLENLGCSEGGLTTGVLNGITSGAGKFGALLRRPQEHKTEAFGGFLVNLGCFEGSGHTTAAFWGLENLGRFGGGWRSLKR